MRRILFVCTGNTCRSPMAMAIFNSLASLEPFEFGYEAMSAGLAVSKDAPPSANAVLAVKDSLGIDIAKHRAHILSPVIIEEAFLVLTMTLSHKHYILSMFPEEYQKVFTLKEYVYNIPENTGKSSGRDIETFSLDIADPYGSSLWSYKICAQEITQAIKKLVEILKKS